MSDFRSLTLYVIRHGECEHNVEGWAASHDDSPLTENGRQQARTNGRLLREVAGHVDELDYFASSCIARARQWRFCAVNRPAGEWLSRRPAIDGGQPRRSHAHGWKRARHGSPRRVSRRSLELCVAEWREPGDGLSPYRTVSRRFDAR